MDVIIVGSGEKKRSWAGTSVYLFFIRLYLIASFTVRIYQLDCAPSDIGNRCWMHAVQDFMHNKIL